MKQAFEDSRCGEVGSDDVMGGPRPMSTRADTLAALSCSTKISGSAISEVCLTVAWHATSALTHLIAEIGDIFAEPDVSK